MHDFRKKSREPRQAIDGFLNAPQRPQFTDRPTGHQHGLSGDGFRSTSGRRVDDFKRAEGYHPVTRAIKQTQPNDIPQQASKASAATQQDQASILHMTLPGGTLEATEKKRRRARKEHGKHSKWRTIRKWSLRSGLALVLIVFIVGGFLLTKGYFSLHKVFKGGGTAAALQSEVKPELLKGEGDGRINVLLLGKGGDGHEGPDLTDTILVASIDPINKTANLVSIPRDLWVTVQGYGSTKINSVYANAKYRAQAKNPKDKAAAESAGITSIKETVTQVLGIPIHYYGMVDFHAFRQAVDTVGGVDFNVPTELAVSEHMWDEEMGKNYYLNVPAGMQHFDGTRALFFTRSRHTSPRGDFDRTERQRIFLQALAQKVLSAGTYTNPVKVSQLMTTFGDHIATDFSITDGLRLAQIAKDIGTANIKSIGLADPPNNYVRTDNVNGLSIVRPTAGIGDYSQIQNYIRNTLKDPYLSKEAATLMVLNGTTVPGLAGTKGDQLKSYGYNVVKVDTAPTQDYQKTQLIDLTAGKKPYTKNYLEKRLGVKATTKLPDPNIAATGADFVIILGQDETTSSQN